jgi:Cu/Ag efflux pump CusA
MGGACKIKVPRGAVGGIYEKHFRSLAVVIICGLSFATILTLIVVPTLYAVFFNVKAEEVAEA